MDKVVHFQLPVDNISHAKEFYSNVFGMKVLLISSNREHFPEPVFPLGAVYIANSLIHHGADVRIFDAGLYSFPLYSLKKELIRYQPDIIGLSLRNIDNASYPSTRYYVSGYVKIMNTIRSMSKAPIVLGGSAFTIFPEELMEYLGADMGIKGEGESAVSQFREKGGKGIYEEMVSDPGDISFPRNIDTIFPFFHYYRTIGIQTARGCPHRCIYCTYPLLERSRRRLRLPYEIADEIEHLNKHFNKSDFFIVDSSFNSDEEHMAGVLEAIISRNLAIRFSCYLQPRIEDPSIFGLLKRAGCVAVDFGTDSGSPSIVHSLRKGFTVDDIRRVSQSCRKAGIDFCHSLIFGGPGETPETIRETITLMNEVSPKAVIAMIGIRIYPGTEIEQIAQEEGQLCSKESLLKPRFYFGPLGPGRLSREIFENISGRNWFFPGERDWSSSIGPRILRHFYTKGPLWRTFKTENIS
ncbi:MAG: radical SAM protein [Nitrospinae bacterium]|nr:radical SAM protein [Nitrospinota bacterium]